MAAIVDVVHKTTDEKAEDPLLVFLLVTFLFVFTLRTAVQTTDRTNRSELGLEERIKRKLRNNLERSRRVKPRVGMAACPPIYGKVGVFVAVDSQSINYSTSIYAEAQASLRCYLKSTNYSFFYVDVLNDPKDCGLLQSDGRVVFRKHCSAAVYLREVDWLLVLDADTGVVNPNHCIEEWIDDRVDMIFYERFYHFEIACGNYLMRNTRQAREFLMGYANLETVRFSAWDASDNGPLLAKAETEACASLYRNATSFETYLAYVVCVKVQLGANRRMFPGVLRIHRRGHSKPSKAPPDILKVKSFLKPPELEKCGPGTLDGWHHDPAKQISARELKEALASYEVQTRE
ncbi:hypothetical protein M3Y99_00023600 [Aphelenchoides fujianensis]|nr:hypothetical protein M3Y99_00023600 [Aphelenchoides fujianensis]